MLLSGGSSAEFDSTHVSFIDVPGKRHGTDFPDFLMKDILSILNYFILSALKSVVSTVKQSRFCKTNSLVSNATQSLSSAFLN